MPLSYDVKKIFSLIGLFVLSFSVIHSEERTDFKVNDDAGIATQNTPRIAVSYDRSFIICWIDARNGSNDVYVQKYDTSGYPIGTNKKINDDSNDAFQLEPAIDVDYNGYFSIVWKDFRNGSYPFDPDVYIQRYDSTLNLLGTNDNLTTNIPNALKEAPDISLSQSGLGVVTWADYRNGNWDVFCQLISADGSLVGGNIQVNDDAFSAQQHAPKVSMSNQGWFVVTWYDNRNGQDDIYIQLYDTTGTPLYTNTKVNQDINGQRQAFPDVATDGAGNFTVVWVDWRNGSYPENPDIYSKKYTSDLAVVASEGIVNKDGTLRAQREPSISADRLGNVAIIWADSIGQSWDISGQMIDVDGVVRESNFKANTDTDSAQVKPDVALDGNYRYLTWVDRRNGNYDIYASIQIYNDPSIAVFPPFVELEMQSGAAIPDPFPLIVEHLGYNPLDFSVSSDVSWLSVSPTSSTTSDSIFLSITTDTLGEGNHFGNLTFVDESFNDTSVIVPVRLSVYKPRMKLSKDTLSFRFFEGVTQEKADSVVLQNETKGTYNWTASTSSVSIGLSSLGGVDSDTVEVKVNSEGMTAGILYERVIFDAENTNGAPDTLIVKIEIINDMAYLYPIPDSIFIYTDSLDGLTGQIQVDNYGIGSLNWSASVTGGFFSLDSYTGVENDIVTITFDSTSYGRHIGSVTFVDSSAFNITTVVPVIVEFYRQSDDTLKVSSTIVETNESGSVSLTINSVSGISELFCPLRFDTTYIRIDSIMPSLSYPSILTMNTAIDNLSGYITILLETNPSDTTIPLGDSHLAEIFFTSKSEVGVTVIDTSLSDNSSLYLLTGNSERYTPHYDTGNIVITIATDVSDLLDPELPQEFDLSQNYPNPFNVSTTIGFSLPTRSEITLVVYNILGQKIRTLADGYYPAGNHLVDWDGHINNGSIAPTGVYFYRLESNSSVFVKKMLLLK